MSPLFEPAICLQSVSSAAAARNTKFLAEYAGRDMKPRTITQVDLPEDQIQSGDFFGIIRLDGLDPMLAWAMVGSDVSVGFVCPLVLVHLAPCSHDRTTGLDHWSHHCGHSR